MIALNKQALREAAEKALPAMKRLLMMPNDELFDEALLNVDGDVDAANAFNLLAGPETVLALLDENLQLQRDKDSLEAVAIAMRDEMRDAREKLEAAEKRIAELEAREVKPVAWMRNANVTSFMSRFTTDENYAVEQWGDDAVALYSLPVDFIPACFTDERNLMHINERGRETSLIWSERNSEDGDIQLFRAAGIGVKGE